MAISQITSRSLIARHFYGIVLAWTLFIICLFFLSIYIHHAHIKSAALNEAQSDVKRIRAIRSWIIKQGGVYAPTTELLPPSPYITAKPNSVQTVSGQQLTLLSPSYFIKETNRFLDSQHIAMVKLTSMFTVDPANRPDAWEKAALQRFTENELVHSEFVNIDDKPYLRYMEGFITKGCCLEFYAGQDYKLGEVQGGISFTIPMTHFSHSHINEEMAILATFVAVWLIGLTGIRFSYSQLSRSDLRRNKAEQELRDQKENLDYLVKERTAELEKSLQDLKQSTLLREAAFQATLDSIIILDSQYRIIAINEVGAKRLDANPTEIIGTSIFDLLPEEVASYRQQLFDEARASGQPVHVMNDPRGGYIFETNIVPIFDQQDQELLYFAIFASDVTSRYNAQQELVKQKAELENKVKERTFALAQTNLELQQEGKKRQEAYEQLQEQKASLEEANTALKVLLAQTDDFKNEFQEQVLASFLELVVPSLVDLKGQVAGSPAEGIVNTIQFHINNLNSSFSSTLSSKHFGLSSREIQIASLIRDDRTTKEIAQLLHISPGTVSSYRDNIRKKLQIKNEKVSLKSYLQSKFK